MRSSASAPRRLTPHRSTTSLRRSSSGRCDAATHEPAPITTSRSLLIEASAFHAVAGDDGAPVAHLVAPALVEAPRGHSHGDGLDALDHDAALLVSFPGTITRHVALVKLAV